MHQQVPAASLLLLALTGIFAIGAAVTLITRFVGADGTEQPIRGKVVVWLASAAFICLTMALVWMALVMRP